MMILTPQSSNGCGVGIGDNILEPAEDERPCGKPKGNALASCFIGEGDVKN